jgi:hypothetical protein
MGMPELEIYSMIGAEGFGRLVAAFYRQVPQDDLLGPIYPASDLPGAEQRLRDFLIGRFGGPRLTLNKEAIPASVRGIRLFPSIRLCATAGCGSWTMRWGKLRCQAVPKKSFGNSSMRCRPS